MTPLPPRLQHAQIPPHVRQVLARLKEEGQAFLVGGCVRDLLRGVAPKDYDVATDLLPARVQRLFPHTVPTGIAHGTVTVVALEGNIEVTTFRGEEGYADGRHPDRVFFHQEIEADLARRDFTINAIAYDPLGPGWVDPYCGWEDLNLGVVRCVGDPLARFAEDGLRPLRAVRFSSVLRFALDPATRDAISQSLSVYARVAVERILAELRKMLAGPRPSVGLRLLVQTSLSERVIPGLMAEAPAELEHRFRRVDRAPRRIRLPALFVGHLDALRSLKPSAADLTQARCLQDHLEPLLPESSDADLRRFASRVGVANLADVLSLQRAELAARGDQLQFDAHLGVRRRLARLLEASPPLTVGALALDGSAVTRLLGGRSGPEVGAALRRLLEAVLDDPACNTADGLSRLLR